MVDFFGKMASDMAAAGATDDIFDHQNSEETSGEKVEGEGGDKFKWIDEVVISGVGQIWRLVGVGWLDSLFHLGWLWVCNDENGSRAAGK